MQSWQETFGALKEKYLKRSSDRLAEILQVLDGLIANPNDEEAIRKMSRSFHWLAGSGSMYGFKEVSRLGAKGEQLPQTSTWTLKGHPLPYLPIIYKKEDFLSPPYRVSKGYLRGLSYLKSIPDAVFPVEKIQGPILLISGSDDHVWPSSIMSNMVQDRLEKYNFSYPVKHLRYENAGHFIGLPNLPTTGKIFGSMSAGGNQQDDAIASYDSWNTIIKFLENI